MEMRADEKDLLKLYSRRDRIDLQPKFQRDRVWGRQRQQKLLDTIFKKWHIPKVYLRVVDEYNFDCVDGQQRLGTVFQFYNNKLPLPKYTPRYGGMLYRQLPDRIKEIFDDYELQIELISDASDEEIEELFLRLQLGKPLNSAEKLNAIGGDMRDFVKELSKHRFFEKVHLRNTRFAYDSVCAQVCLLELKGVRNAKYKDLEEMYNQYKKFDATSPEIKRVQAIFDFLNFCFPNKTSELSNRASIVSLYLFVSELMKKIQLSGKEKIIENFYVRFLRKLRLEVEKGPNAEDAELITYQSAVNQAADSRESIKTRQAILLKKFVEGHPGFQKELGIMEYDMKVLALEKERQLKQLSDDILELISECNEIYYF